MHSRIGDNLAQNDWGMMGTGGSVWCKPSFIVSSKCLQSVKRGKNVVTSGEELLRGRIECDLGRNRRAG